MRTPTGTRSAAAQDGERRVEPPAELAAFLAAAGAEWPRVNEDAVRVFAGYTREYADDLEAVHRAALRTVRELGAVFSGPAYDDLRDAYETVAEARFVPLFRAVRECADRLDFSAGVIAVMKAEVIEELTAPVPGGTPDGAVARKQVAHLERQLEHYVVDQVLEVAVERVVEAVARALDSPAPAEAAARVAAFGRGEPVGPGHRIDAPAVQRHAEELHACAERVSALGRGYCARLGTLDFE